MNFFKKLFSSEKQPNAKHEEQVVPDTVFTEEYFKKRYTEQDITADTVVLDGCIRMIDGYFIDNKLERSIESPVEHPTNLDQVIEDGMGFQMYCGLFNFKDGEAAMFLALAFSNFLINKYGFKLYQDSQPEFPLRKMTLKYDKNGSILSLYPFEYSMKVIKNEARFEALHQKINGNIASMPDYKEVLRKFIDDNNPDE